MIIQFNVSPAYFLEKHQERKPLIIRDAFQKELFSWQDANEIFERADVASKDFKLSYDGIRPKHEYVESYLDIGTLRHRLIKPVVYDYLKKGATLIANKIVNEPKVNVLARQIAEFTGRQTVTSAYAAFGEKDSFRAHWDTRDVFAIQLIGRKRWIIYEPSFELPLYMQQSKDYEHLYPCPERPCMDFILEAGDIFYLPRGWWHNPLPIGEETFHLAVGTFPAYIIDYAQWALQQLPEFVGSRKSLDNWEQDKGTVTTLGQYLDNFLADSNNYRRFMDEFLSASRVESPLAIELFGNPNASQLTDDNALRLNVNKPHRLSDSYVIANGTKLNLDETGKLLIQSIADSPGIHLSDLLTKLPEIDPSQLRTLIHQLCHQDILERVRY